jgi:pimeloyl-ACP methyl ester carboxylesterase
MELKHHTAKINGIDLHYVESGSGPLVVFLHGFPEFWYSWRHQLPALVEAGYRVVAPDMRGYNKSESPRAVSEYHVDKLTGDVVALIEHLGEERAHVVGHDWGAIVAWLTAMWHPERIEKLAILNVPHPKRFQRGLWRPSQLLKSWYVFLFQLPLLPEFFFKAGNFYGLRRTLRRDPVRKGAFSEEDIERYVTAFRDTGAVRSGINYYRSSFRNAPAMHKRLKRITAETLVIWGRHDNYLGKHLAEPYPEDVPNCRIEYLEASHWVQVDAPEDVNRLLIDFLGAKN